MAVNPTQEYAALLLDTFLMVKRTLGAEMKKRPAPELSMQQFRTMKIIERHQGASLSLVSEHMGATISTTSKLVDGLVDRGYIARQTAVEDRRRLMLELTVDGNAALERVRIEAISRLASKLECLSPGECAMLKLALDLLQKALGSAMSDPQMNTDGKEVASG